MANNRLWLVCRPCDEGPLLAKCFAKWGTWTPDDEAIDGDLDGFLLDHQHCGASDIDARHLEFRSEDAESPFVGYSWRDREDRGAGYPRIDPLYDGG